MLMKGRGQIKERTLSVTKTSLVLLHLNGNIYSDRKYKIYSTFKNMISRDKARDNDFTVREGNNADLIHVTQPAT